MRIPLDYYRILGLPIQATGEQLRQAHRDRTLQLPRREYSDAAIAARKKLLDQAYSVLSSAEERKSYDSGFLAKTYELAAESNLVSSDLDASAIEDPNLIDPHTPSIEIDDDQFIGALLILQELGEYELVLKLGRPFLTGGSASLKNQKYGDPTIVFSDIVLTVALACLELGREQWQQGQYENAAEALETGQQLLLREGLFVNVRGEIQSDLYRLRPYRILELLASPEEYLDDRQTGMQLLQDMLSERGGIDGIENDQSGLSVDDFLKFIQQLRTYLTAEEQQYLFEQEASRPSAVATYLAVYALLARGFAERHPDLIHQAKHYLAPLSNRQDVHLEQAISALLLGQTEEASKALELSQEQDSIAFIRQHSHNSPDLLPGLCLYTERWFHDEVFPHFRDLTHCRISLKEYFADRNVQRYLESLPDDAEVHARSSVPLRAAVIPTAQWAANKPAEPRYASDGIRTNTVQQESLLQADGSTDHEALIATARARIASRTTATLGSEDRFAGGVSTAERIEEPGLDDDADSSYPLRSQSTRPGDGHKERGGSDPMPPRKTGNRSTQVRSQAAPAWLIPAGALLGIVLLGLLGSWLFRSLRPSPQPAAQVDESPLVQLDKPLLASSEEVTDPTATATLDNEAAKQLIDSWLTAKSKAMGSTYEVAALDQILVDPKLSEWRNASDEAKRDGWYRTYKHDVTVESVELLSATGQVISSSTTPNTSASPTASPSPSPEATVTSPMTQASPDGVVSPSPVSPSSTTDATTISPTVSPSPAEATAEQARVIANVSETTETMRDGKSDGAAQAEQLRVQYILVRKDGKWRIQDWQLQ